MIITNSTRYLYHSISTPPPGGAGTPSSGLYGEVPPERDVFFKLAVYKKVRENGHFSIRKGHKISCKVE